jgi:hypothetical protein
MDWDILAFWRLDIMKNTTRFLIVITLVAFLLSACQPKVEVTYIEGDEKSEVIAVAQPIAEHILAGVASNDYALFSQDFDAEMKAALTATQFEAIVKTYGGLGQLQSTELINIEDKTEFYGVNFKVTYPEKVVLMLIVLAKSDPDLVSGLWFK